MDWLRRVALWTGLILLALLNPASGAATKLPSPAGPVTDLAGILDAGTQQQLLRIIREVQERTTAEIAILTVPSTEPLTIEEYSVAIFDRWKIGKRGQDNGLLFLVAVRDRRMRITTGYGLEGILPDGKVGEIRDREILPYFRTGRYAEGIRRGTQALATVMLTQGADRSAGQQKPVLRPPYGQSQSGDRSLGILQVIIVTLAIFFAVLLAIYRQARARNRGRRRGRRDFWGPFYLGSGFGGALGGWSGGGFSSGGFGGFGGGSTGGGGAGGSW